MIDKRNRKTLWFVDIVNRNRENKLDLEHENEARCKARKKIHFIRTWNFNFFLWYGKGKLYLLISKYYILDSDIQLFWKKIKYLKGWKRKIDTNSQERCSIWLLKRNQWPIVSCKYSSYFLPISFFFLTQSLYYSFYKAQNTDSGCSSNICKYVLCFRITSFFKKANKLWVALMECSKIF